MGNSIARDIKTIFRQKSSVLTECILLLLIMGNYIKNIFVYRGTELSRMYYPMKLILVSLNNINDRADFSILFIFLFPILAILPYGFNYVNEHNTGIEFLVRARIGDKRYVYSKILSSFTCTFAIFAIPLIADIVITGLTFPISAKGDLLNYSIYSVEYLSVVDRYWMSGFFYKNPLLYTIVFSLGIAVFAGLMSAFTTGLSYAFPLKYRVFLILPVYFIMNLTIAFDGVFGDKNISISWYENLMLFGELNKSGVLVFLFSISLMALTWIFVLIGKQRRKTGRVQI